MSERDKTFVGVVRDTFTARAAHEFTSFGTELNLCSNANGPADGSPARAFSAIGGDVQVELANGDTKTFTEAILAVTGVTPIAIRKIKTSTTATNVLVFW